MGSWLVVENGGVFDKYPFSGQKNQPEG